MVLIDLPKFKFHLTRQGKRQRQLARIIGVDESLLSGFLRGKRKLSDRHVVALARALGVDLADITSQAP